MSDLRVDMSDRHRICQIWDRICPVNQDYEQQKSRSDTKMINLGHDKLTTSKQDTKEHIEISRVTRCNLFT
jgi:hypothetical protein